MSAILRRFGAGTGSDIYIPIVKAGSVDFAVGADWTPAAGDVTVSIDGVVGVNITTLPVPVVMGNSVQWKFVFTDAELTGATITVMISDAAVKAIEDQFILIETYNNTAAQHDLLVGSDGLVQADVARLVTSGEAAAGLQAFMLALKRGLTVDTATFAPTTTQFEVDNLAENLDDVFVGQIIRFTVSSDGSLTGVHTRVTAFEGTATNPNGKIKFTVSPALPAAPGNTDQLIFVGVGTGFLSAAQVNAEVVDVLTVDTFAEPTTVPAATVSLEAKIGWLYSLSRNKGLQTASLKTLRNDADTLDIATSVVNDSGITFTRDEYT